MKKKLLITLLALVSALCCAFGLAACGGDGDNTGGLAADEFAAKFSTAKASGYTFTYTYFATHTFEADVVNNRYLAYNKAEGVTKYTNKFLHAKTGDKYYYYQSEEDGVWWLPALEISETLFNKNISNYGIDEIKDEIEDVGDTRFHLRGLAEFNETVINEKGNLFASVGENKYEANNVSVTDVGKASKVAIELKSGKLASINVTNYCPEGRSETGGTDYSFTKFGETTVELPTDDYIVEPEMNAEEWNACINAFAAKKNFSLQMRNKTSEGDIVAAMRLDGDTYYESQGKSYNRYDKLYEKDGENYYRYRVVDNKYIDNSNLNKMVWYKTESDETTYNNAVLDNVALVNGAAVRIATNYTGFSYKHNVYSVKTMQIAEGFTLKDLKITVKNGEVKHAECIWEGVEDNVNHIYRLDRYVTVDEVGTTEIEFTALPENLLGQAFVLKEIQYFTDDNRYAVPDDIKAKCNASKEKEMTFGENGAVGGAFDFGFGAVGEFTGEKALTATQRSVYENTLYYDLLPEESEDYIIKYMAYDNHTGELRLSMDYTKGEAVFILVWKQPK